MKPSIRIWITHDDDAYTPLQVQEILLNPGMVAHLNYQDGEGHEAERQGHPLQSGSYIEKMTIRQLDGLVRGRYDA